ncbi:MAG: hypothetical protein PWP15_242 [Methanothermococcus sp.]|jgi:hypothetical protein|nr:hypothetical protein [Methanothermococcus sp.]MDK2986950.1 hypothetical protein [Methanothermococcus sp.]
MNILEEIRKNTVQKSQYLQNKGVTPPISYNLAHLFMIPIPNGGTSVEE